MGIFKCRNGCGATCHSKNPATRSVFIISDTMEDRMIDTVRSIMSFNVEPDKFGHGEPPPMDLVVRVTLWSSEDKIRGIQKLRDYLGNITDQQIERMICSHSWEPVNGPQDYEV